MEIEASQATGRGGLEAPFHLRCCHLQASDHSDGFSCLVSFMGLL